MQRREALKLIASLPLWKLRVTATHPELHLHLPFSPYFYNGDYDYVMKCYKYLLNGYEYYTSHRNPILPVNENTGMLDVLTFHNIFWDGPSSKLRGIAKNYGRKYTGIHLSIIFNHLNIELE